MRRLSAALLVAAIAVAPITSDAADTKPTIELTGALSKQRVIAFGTVTPPRDGARARLTLLQEQSDGWVALASKRVELTGARDSNGDGRRDSRFTGSFSSPENGSCKLRLRVRGNSRFAPAKARVELPCARPDFPTGTATLIAGTEQKDVDVEIADTSSLQAFGLMYKRRLGAEKGMAFQFDGDSTGGFWMKNTLIPLSIAFYSADGTIVRIMDMEPCYPPPPPEEGGCPIYDPETSYQGALEVNQGAFEAWGISEGDRVVVMRDGP